jgi:hypothetical protein
LEGKEMRIFISTNGRKTGFSGDMGDWAGGKLLKGKGEFRPGHPGDAAFLIHGVTG